MSAVVHLLVGPAGSGKTGRLLERYRAVSRAAAGTTLWIGPNARQVDALRCTLLGGRDSGLAPGLFTFQDFVEEIIRVNDPTARPLSDVQRRLLADDLVGWLYNRGDLSHFQPVIETRGFAEGVFAFLAELKRNGVLPDELARVVNQPAGAAVSTKASQCVRIYAAYQNQLLRHNLYDLEGRFWYARDLVAAGRRQPFEGIRAVFVDGFTDLTRVQLEILATFSTWVEELWVALPGERGDERAELFTRPRAAQEWLRARHARVEHLPGSPSDATPALPAGLTHIERQLFRPLRAVSQAADAEGVCLLEAPGTLGEARMVAREIKTLLASGVPAEEILVILREVPPYADLIREVFAEYGIPIDLEGTEPLARNPAVATFLRALRLPEEDWPFAGVTALLRSTYFRPDWPETQDDPNIAQHAEALLRLLGEPRSRDAYRKAVERWAESAVAGLEDEQAEESRRRRTHELAQRCRPFLRRFFSAWDNLPAQAPLAVHAQALRQLADRLGLVRAAAEDARDRAALERLGEELDAWVRLDHLVRKGDGARKAGQVFRILSAIAVEAGLARTPRGPGRVRVLSAPLARGLATPYVFVMGLGERSFPRLAAPEPFFEEHERLAFKEAGLDFLSLGELMPEEMLLFYQVVTRARRRLVLSYPAVDDKGQVLLPSSFLNTLLECFQPNAVPVKRWRMLIEGYDREVPLCPAEGRVQLARETGFSAGPPAAAGGLDANLAAAYRVAARRFRDRAYGPYDGMLRHAGVIAELQQQLGPHKVFSPTALEDYIACPFRFFLGDVLHLEPLEEPREEIEETRRGQAFHRALSRLHRQLKEAGVHQPTDDVEAALQAQLERAVQEYMDRAPSLASAELWRLEGQRLRRLATRYRPHWARFLAPWLAEHVAPRPELFEKNFGLPPEDGEAAADPLVLRVDGVEVRLGGRIDRVDLAELADGVGFWVIDYKTGRGQHYTARDLQTFQRLQLTLYAVAVEKVLLAGQKARPLGLAYWLVADSGPKLALPSSSKQLTAWLKEDVAWGRVREQLERWVATLVRHIREGTFPLKPRSDTCTETCEFAQVCRISQARPFNKAWELPLPVVSGS